jgi:hypothetical protein
MLLEFGETMEYDPGHVRHVSKTIPAHDTLEGPMRLVNDHVIGARTAVRPELAAANARRRS